MKADNGKKSTLVCQFGVPYYSDLSQTICPVCQEPANFHHFIFLGQLPSYINLDKRGLISRLELKYIACDDESCFPTHYPFSPLKTTHYWVGEERAKAGHYRDPFASLMNPPISKLLDDNELLIKKAKQGRRFEFGLPLL
jgi:hypothetical protein